jgi:hypothetical protein
VRIARKSDGAFVELAAETAFGILWERAYGTPEGEIREWVKDLICACHANDWQRSEVVEGLPLAALSFGQPRLATLVLQLMAQQPTNESIEHLRDQARRARRLAATLSGDADRHRLISHAEELEETAAQLERQAHGKPRGKS